mgnify:CR=1 FL=1
MDLWIRILAAIAAAAARVAAYIAARHAAAGQPPPQSGGGSPPPGEAGQDTGDLPPEPPLPPDIGETGEVDVLETVTGADFVGDDIEYFGDSLPSSYATFLNLVQSDDQWEQNPALSIRDLFLYVRGVRVDQNLSRAALEILLVDGVTNATDRGQSANDLISDLEVSAENLGININFDRYTAEEALSWFREGAANRFYSATPDAPITLDDIRSVLAEWYPTQLAFGAPEDVSADTIYWAIDSFPEYFNLETTRSGADVAEYVRTWIGSGLSILDVDIPTQDIEDMSLPDLLSLYQQAAYAEYQEDIALEASGDWNPTFIDEVTGIPFTDVETVMQQRRERNAIEDAMHAAAELHSAFENTYRSPDYSLLLLVASIVCEPADWIITGVEIVQDIRNEDWGNALLNFGLLVTPFVSGSLDDLTDVVRGADDVPTGVAARSERSLFAPNNTVIAAELEELSDRTFSIVERTDADPELFETGIVLAQPLTIEEISTLSRYYNGLEIAVVQNTTNGQLRLIFGTSTGIPVGMRHPNEVFIAHTHPAYTDKLVEPSFDDLSGAGEHVEMIIGMTPNTSTFYDNSGVVGRWVLGGGRRLEITTSKPLPLADPSNWHSPLVGYMYDIQGNVIRTASEVY